MEKYDKKTRSYCALDEYGNTRLSILMSDLPYTTLRAKYYRTGVSTIERIHLFEEIYKRYQHSIGIY